MKGQTSEKVLGACLFASLILGGCNHVEHTKASTAPPLAARDAGRQRTPVSSPAVIASQPASAVPTRATAPVEEAPAFVNAPELTPVAAEVSAAPPAPVLPQAAPEEIKTCAWRGEPAPARRTYADITAQPNFGHAPDYTWVTGELQHWQATKSWRLRYCSVDETDPYGGSVTLVGGERQLDTLKDGQCVRVQGSLLHPDTAGSAPAYQVELIQPVQH